MPGIDPSAPNFDLESRIAAQNRSAAVPSIGSTGNADGAAHAPSFAQTLQAANQGITISGHAQTRLASRQINLTAADYLKLSDAMQKAASKGARSSLVLMDRSGSSGGQVGLVVSIPNRTVITAVDTQSLKENIFTNIDSAMII